MAYEITPEPTSTPAADFPVPTVRVLNFTGTGFTCSRGTGEQSNVITIEITPPTPVEPDVPWNSLNYTLASGLPGDQNPSVAFSDEDYTVAIYFLPG